MGKLSKNEFVEFVGQFNLTNYDIIITLNDNAKSITKLFATEKQKVFQLDKLIKEKSKWNAFLDQAKKQEILLVSDVSASGKTLEDAKSLFEGIAVKTFAVSGKADFVVTTNTVCATEVIDFAKPRKFLGIPINVKSIGAIVVGLFALLWVLARTGTNPKRAAYPCQQAAMPFALIFLGYLSSLFGIALAYKKIIQTIKNHKYIAATLFLLMGMVSFALFSNFNAEKAYAYTPPDGSNNPMGTAKGIKPGRVVWVHNPDATDWVKNVGFWWEDTHTNGSVVDNMLRQNILLTTGKTTEVDAWDAIFHFFNNNYGKGDVGYKAGEKVAIKINCNNTRDSHAQQTNSINPSPHLVLSLVRQLVNNAGVPAANITIYDGTRYITDNIYNKVRGEFPDVVFVDAFGGDGRVLRTWTSDLIKYSAPTYCGSQIASCVKAADYLINLSIMKQHPIAGVTLVAKNHYGTINGLDHSQIDPNNGMDKYSPFVDFMGSKELGGKTLFYIMDALFCAFHSDVVPDLWGSAPFNNDWPSSILTSLDPVALSSVGCDMLISERGTNLPNFVDHDLHEMALCANAPSGVKYDPNSTGGLASLGVHEHWNSPTSRQYSRNLDPINGKGIELIYVRDNNSPPSISITAPTTGNNVAVGNNVKITTNPSDYDGTITAVTFYSNSKVIGTVTSAPWEFTMVSPAIGAYTLMAEATDDKGGKTSSTVVNINVVDPNAPPIAEAGTNKIIYQPITSVDLDGSASLDPNKKAITYAWTQIGGPSTATITGSTTSKPNVSNLVLGTYTFQVTVNNGSKSSTDQVQVTLYAAVPRNIALHKTATSSTQNGGNSAAQAVDSNMGTRYESQFVSPSWIKVDLGKTYDISKVVLKWEAACGSSYYIMVADVDITPDPTNPQWTKISSQSGLANAARVDSLKNLSGSGRYIVMWGYEKPTGYGYSLWEFEVYGTEKKVNIMPTVNAGNDTTITGSTVPLMGSAKDVDGYIKTYQWSQISGPNTATFANATAAIASASSLVKGVYLFKLTATDDSNGIVSDSVKITVDNATDVEVLDIIKSSVYPNPANETVIIKYTEGETGSLRILDQSGKEIYTCPLIKGENTIPVSNLIGGIYYLEIKSDKNAITTKKLMKQ